MNHPSTRRGRHRTAAVVLLLIVALLVPGGAHAYPGADETAGPRTNSPQNRGSGSLPSSELQELVERFDRREALGSPGTARGDRVRVLIEHRLPAGQADDALARLGASRRISLGVSYVEADVPIAALRGLQDQPWVQFVQPAPRKSPPLGRLPASFALSVDGGQVGKTGAGNWHAVGLDGTGVAIGIIDDFDQNIWNAAQANGDLPGPAGTVCFSGGVACNIWNVTPGATHGAAVAEVVHEMAPGAALYLANGFTPGDLRSAIDYFADQGVRVVNFSATFPYDGPGDGTGPTAEVIDYATSKGMAWINSAGNFAGGPYWRGTWADADNDGWLEFADGSEVMAIQCGWALGLRWDDWNVVTPTDYDVFIWDTVADVGVTPKAVSSNDQTVGANAVENFGSPLLAAGCTNGELDHISVLLYAPGDGAPGDVLEIGMEQWLEFSSDPYSAAIPMADTANPGAVAVGAIDPPLGATIAAYSSRGPTNDDRIKPDLSAPAGMLTFSTGAFAGTSAAAPVVAGAAALLFDAKLVNTPVELKNYLLGSAVVDRGAPGADDDYGAGELFLGDPPNQPPTAVDDLLAGTEDTRLVVAAPGILANDSDPEGDDLSVSGFDAVSAEGGTVVVEADGSVTYDPPAGFAGEDIFTYTVSDGALSDTATVTVAVNGSPEGVDDLLAGTEDTRLVVAAPGVLANDSDPEGDGLSVSGFDAVSAEGGTVVVGADGSVTYDPPGGFVGDDSFSYTVSDGTLTDSASVTVTVASAPPAGGGGGGGGGAPPPAPSLPTQLEACPSTLPAPGFLDLAGYPAETVNAISCLTAYQISQGTSQESFSPEGSVSRRQMALFLIRLIVAYGFDLPVAGSQGFDDVVTLPADTQAAINQLAVLGVTQGTSPTTFDPNGSVTRWQMALFLTRVAVLVGIPLSEAPPGVFTDVAGFPPETQTAINQLAAAGIARGTGATTFGPDADVLRWQMALFLARVLQAGGATLQ